MDERSDTFTVQRLGGDLQLISACRYGDERGWLSEIFNQAAFSEMGFPVFDQDNLSRTLCAGTVRGLHWQASPHSQAKLFRVVRGRVFNVVVNVTDEAFGAVETREMDDERCEWLFIPPGRAHGFQALDDAVEVHYKVSSPLVPTALRTLRYDDPALAIPWPIAPRLDLLSVRDRSGRPLDDFRPAFADRA